MKKRKQRQDEILKEEQPGRLQFLNTQHHHWGDIAHGQKYNSKDHDHQK